MGTWIVLPPGCCSISALSSLILLFILARLCIGGVPLLVESFPSHCMLPEFWLALGERARLLFEPMVPSSFYTRVGTFTKSSIRSNFIIEFVGMFGVSFSKPPCMNTVASIAQTLWRNRCRELNLRHSLDSVSYTSSYTFSPTVFVLPPKTSMSVPTKIVECW
jgi:hypothetical protein